MKKGIFTALLLTTTSLFGGFNLVHAADSEAKPIKLKNKCIKQNPQAKGQTDAELLALYQQVCDKKNAEPKDELLAQAALRLYELDQPMNALLLAQQLKQRNVQSNTLTDATFLAGVALANQALTEMRSDEMRSLTSELTYPPAKELGDNIRMAMPAPDTSNAKAITDETLKNRAAAAKTAKRPVAKTAPANSRSSTAAKPRPATSAKPPASTPPKTSASPFDSLK